MPRSITTVHVPVDLWQQVCAPMTKHAHRVTSLANEDVNLVGLFDNVFIFFYESLTVITFEFACKSICSFGETFPTVELVALLALSVLGCNCLVPCT